MVVFLLALSSCGLCALLNGTLKLTAHGRKSISHSLPAFHIFIFSQAALWSQALGLLLTLAGQKYNKAPILLHLPLSSCYPAARISCQYKICFNLFSKNLTTMHSEHCHIRELPSASCCDNAVYV